jgi:UV DNA damage endonuclease
MRSRLVLENDDVIWGVHDLLPLSNTLSIPLVINYPNHNIVFDRRRAREGTLDLSEPSLLARVAATWGSKKISQMMAYGESRPGDVDVRDRRSRSARVKTLPPCSNKMDLLVEAEDREQAIFELMRNFKLPGFEGLNDLVPHEREDEERPSKKVPRKKRKKKKGDNHDGSSSGGDEEEQNIGKVVPAEEFGMGGPMRRVFWPIGMENWLLPRKRSSTK